MKKIFIKFISTIAALRVAEYLLSGVKVDGIESFATAAIVLGIVNTFVKPLIILFTLPITLLSLGTFIFIINGIMILLTSYLVPGFEISSFGDGLICAIIIFVVNFVADMLFKKE